MSEFYDRLVAEAAKAIGEDEMNANVDYTAYAQAAVQSTLKMLGEPSEDMIQAGGEVVYDARATSLSVHIARDAFQAMLKAIQ